MRFECIPFNLPKRIEIEFSSYMAREERQMEAASESSTSSFDRMAITSSDTLAARVLFLNSSACCLYISACPLISSTSFSLLLKSDRSLFLSLSIRFFSSLTVDIVLSYCLRISSSSSFFFIILSFFMLFQIF